MDSVVPVRKIEEAVRIGRRGHSIQQRIKEKKQYCP
jgi:hypothetical protein